MDGTQGMRLQDASVIRLMEASQGSEGLVVALRLKFPTAVFPKLALSAVNATALQLVALTASGCLHYILLPLQGEASGAHAPLRQSLQDGLDSARTTLSNVAVGQANSRCSRLGAWISLPLCLPCFWCGLCHVIPASNVPS